MSRPLAIGLFVLLGLVNTYLVTKRFEVRRLREQLISSTLQNHLTEHQSLTDPLTEIYNRRSLDQIAGQFISQARRRGTALTFLMVDADNFKEINTRFGHLTGDFVLAEIAALLRASIRGSDAAVRYAAMSSSCCCQVLRLLEWQTFRTALPGELMNGTKQTIWKGSG